MLITFLLVVHSILAVTMVVLILMQKSEGGGFTGGSTSNSLVAARGQGDILSRSTAVTATMFIITSLLLAWLAAHNSKPQSIDTSLARQAPVSAPVPALPAPATLPAAPAASAPAAPAAPADNVPVAN